MTEPTILVVEDEPAIQEVVSLYLRRAGYNVTTVGDGEAALNALVAKLPDLVVLDLMLPKVDGLAITRWLREQDNVPIIILTARREEQDRITGLEMGADDYVVKPFSPQELVSRVRAVLRRSKKNDPARQEASLTFDGLTIDAKTRLVTVNGQPVTLTAKEFDLLWTLAQHPRQVLSRDRLLRQVWDMTDHIDPSTVTVHVRRLREKLEADPTHPVYIKTVWGVGYKFDP